MGRVLARVGARMLAAVLPQTTAAGCRPPSIYYECAYPHSCNNYSQLSYIKCETYCSGATNCITIRCC